jgi:hypothetical protein
MIKRCHGQYTIQQLQRCGQLSGAFKYQLQLLLSEGGFMGEDSVLPNMEETAADHMAHIKAVQSYIVQYQPNAMFDYCPPRSHRGFENFSRISKIKAPALLGRKLKRLSFQMDTWRNITETANLDH